MELPGDYLGMSQKNCKIQGNLFLKAFNLAFLTYGMWQCPVSVGPAQILRKVLKVKLVGKEEDTFQVIQSCVHSAVHFPLSVDKDSQTLHGARRSRAGGSRVRATGTRAVLNQ